jgi:hypothetical protein
MPQGAVFGSNSGTGKAANFQIDNPASSADALYATSSGSGSAVDAVHTGTGIAGRFQIANGTNAADALYATTNGTGVAGKFIGTKALETVGNSLFQGEVGIANSNWLEFGKGLTKQSDNGKIAYNAFGTANTLSIVGGGTAADGSDRKIKMWADGGTSFTGNINTTRNITANGYIGATEDIYAEGYLDVHGKIKIGNDVNPPAAGNIRWNANVNDFEGYNGTYWISLTANNNPKGWDATTVTERQQLFDVNGLYESHFGSDIAIFENTAIIGSSGSNKAYIFNKINNKWVQSQVLMPNDPTTGDRFGSGVSIKGNWAVVSAHKKTVSGVVEAGKIYLFKYTAALGWTQMQSFSGTEYEENFGTTISMDTDIIIVGSPGKTVNGNSKQGIITTIYFSYETYTWNSYTTISAPDGVAYDRFGGFGGIDIKRNNLFEGPWSMVVGSSLKNDLGKIYLYKGYTLINSFSPSDAVIHDRFGCSVRFNENGDKVIVGSYLKNGAGKAYIYKLNIGNPISWSLEGELSPSDGISGMAFGASVGLSGQYAVAGASNFPGGGKAYVFKKNGTLWTEMTSLVSSDRKEEIINEGDFFGFARINGEDILVGSRKNIGSNHAQGKVYFFTRY